jgi:hypothetical protein
MPAYSPPFFTSRSAQATYPFVTMHGSDAGSSQSSTVSTSSSIAPRLTLHRRQRGTPPATPDLFSLIMASRQSTPESERIANEPPRIKSKSGVVHYRVDRDNSEAVEICRAMIRVSSFLHTRFNEIRGTRRHSSSAGNVAPNAPRCGWKLGKSSPNTKVSRP